MHKHLLFCLLVTDEYFIQKVQIFVICSLHVLRKRQIINTYPHNNNTPPHLIHKHTLKVSVQNKTTNFTMTSLPGPLVSVAWLASQLVRRPSTLRVVDSSWYMPSAKRDPAKEFEERRMSTCFYDISLSQPQHVVYVCWCAQVCAPRLT